MYLVAILLRTYVRFARRKANSGAVFIPFAEQGEMTAFDSTRTMSRNNLSSSMPTVSARPYAADVVPFQQVSPAEIRARLQRHVLTILGANKAAQLRPCRRWILASSDRNSASIAKPTMPMAIMPDITIDVLMLACPL